ncbi:MAG TPA: hypothetical protein VHL80_17700 [Polyangia bacterium]|nr:hypothetical protein [Polyangia bacterium]
MHEASLLMPAAALIARRLPFAPDALGPLLVDGGVASERLGVDEVVRLFKASDLPVPFRRVRRAGADVLVSPTSLASADALISAGTQSVLTFGLASVKGVIERVRSRSARALDEAAAARVLVTLPGLRWLDEASGWFSLAESSSQVGLALRKIFAVAERLPLADLVSALGKRAATVATAPRAVVVRYLSEIAGCDVLDGWVEPRATFVPAQLARAEGTIVELLRRAGGRLTRAELRAQAVAVDIPPTTLREFVRRSPFVEAGPREVRLLGRGVSAAPARIAA